MYIITFQLCELSLSSKSLLESSALYYNCSIGSEGDIRTFFVIFFLCQKLYFEKSQNYILSSKWSQTCNNQRTYQPIISCPWATRYIFLISKQRGGRMSSLICILYRNITSSLPVAVTPLLRCYFLLQWQRFNRAMTGHKSVKWGTYFCILPLRVHRLKFTAESCLCTTTELEAIDAFKLPTWRFSSLTYSICL